MGFVQTRQRAVRLGLHAVGRFPLQALVSNKDFFFSFKSTRMEPLVGLSYMFTCIYTGKTLTKNKIKSKYNFLKKEQ